MNRAEGFAVMDVSTSICEDPKFRRIQRETPELVAPAFAAYVAVMAESWRIGKRATVEEAWPLFLRFDTAVTAALREAGLTDVYDRLPLAVWRETFGRSQRRIARERNRQPSGAEWAAICEAYGHRCAYCGATGRLQVEHHRPLIRGGTNARRNIVPACPSCNGRKGGADPADWPIAAVPS